VFDLVGYLANLTPARITLFCYLIWYLVVAIRYFDPNPWLWLTSLGLSLIVGYALLINATSSGATKVSLGGWQKIRFFVVPFCVSSFSALVKGHNFILIFSPNPTDTLIVLGLCLALLGAIALAKKVKS
jgi:hypothetical protein